MKLGILADVHEEVEALQEAIAVLRDQGADQLIFLGDLCETGRRIPETVAVLAEAQIPGVWGNHDLGLCWDPPPELRAKYGETVVAYMTNLRGWLEYADCHFSHVPPWVDFHSAQQMWYLDGPPCSPELVARALASVPHRVLFLGHHHRWLAASTEGLLPWRGESPILLSPPQRFVVVVHAVWAGWCALFNTDNGELLPLRVTSNSERLVMER